MWRAMEYEPEPEIARVQECFIEQWLALQIWPKARIEQRLRGCLKSLKPMRDG